MGSWNFWSAQPLYTKSVKSEDDEIWWRRERSVRRVRDFVKVNLILGFWV